MNLSRYMPWFLSVRNSEMSGLLCTLPVHSFCCEGNGQGSIHNYLFFSSFSHLVNFLSSLTRYKISPVRMVSITATTT